ncbi:hypothetical protein E2C01_079813 [Portunus trituberculatus]|uniref:Uncharacterized protein n=1 Tax=Portunus trituberculatus TaxID=210409 RepID=A0A5B7IRI3_PORTR|nr:hypothetical protein [Portunus trituberculatus]
MTLGNGSEGPVATLAAAVEDHWTITFPFLLHMEAKGTIVLHHCLPESRPRALKFCWKVCPPHFFTGEGNDSAAPGKPKALLTPVGHVGGQPVRGNCVL